MWKNTNISALLESKTGRVGGQTKWKERNKKISIYCSAKLIFPLSTTWISRWWYIIVISTDCWGSSSLLTWILLFCARMKHEGAARGGGGIERFQRWFLPCSSLTTIIGKSIWMAAPPLYWDVTLRQTWIHRWQKIKAATFLRKQRRIACCSCLYLCISVALFSCSKCEISSYTTFGRIMSDIIYWPDTRPFFSIQVNARHGKMRLRRKNEIYFIRMLACVSIQIQVWVSTCEKYFYLVLHKPRQKCFKEIITFSQIIKFKNQIIFFSKFG